VGMRHQGLVHLPQWIDVQIGLRTVEPQFGKRHQCHLAKFPAF
jgi:hypothetical protein